MSNGLGTLLNESRLLEVADVLPQFPGPDADFDRIARLAQAALEAPTCLITLIAADTQTFRGLCDPGGAIGRMRHGPSEHSLCRHTVVQGETVSITDAKLDPDFADNPVVTEIGVQAYLGIPLPSSRGNILGTICAIDYKSREWTREEIAILSDYAAVAISLLESVASTSRIRAAFDVALHDLKTPLSGLVMATALVEERQAAMPAELKPLFNVVQSSASAAVRLVVALSEQQRAETGGNRSDPATVVRSVLQRLTPLAVAKGISFDLRRNDDRAELRVPEWALEQILENLLSNSIKYSPRDGLIKVSLSFDERQGCFRIHDQGAGFSFEDLDRMFDRYARLSALPTANEDSSGLGLSIVKRLVDQYGGSIRLMSGVNEGADFEIGFPLADLPLTPFKERSDEPVREGQKARYSPSGSGLESHLTCRVHKRTSSS